MVGAESDEEEPPNHDAVFCISSAAPFGPQKFRRLTAKMMSHDMNLGLAPHLHWLQGLVGCGSCDTQGNHDSQLVATSPSRAGQKGRSAFGFPV